MTFPQTFTAFVCAALMQTGPVSAPADRQKVSVRKFQFEVFAAPKILGQQRKSNWCWAAAVQMVLNYHGIFISQEQAVLNNYGFLADQTATGTDILRMLNGYFWSIFAPRVKVSAWAVDMTADTEFINLLSRQQPLIAGLRSSPTLAAGHAYVVTGAEYSQVPNGLYIHSVTVRDPWPSNPSEQVMSWEEFRRRFMFAIGIRADAI